MIFFQMLFYLIQFLIIIIYLILSLTLNLIVNLLSLIHAIQTSHMNPKLKHLEYLINHIKPIQIYKTMSITHLTQLNITLPMKNYHNHTRNLSFKFHLSRNPHFTTKPPSFQMVQRKE